MRINRYLALCGIASRRNSEEYVTEGRVRINGRKVLSLGTDVDEKKDVVTLDGKKLQPIEDHLYLMMHKPKGYICTISDEHDRKTVMDLVPAKYEGKRLFPVGRLDYNTEGLLILTTDGALADRIMHPRNEISKTYVAKIEGEIKEEDLDKLRRGIILDGVKTNKCKIRFLDYTENITRLEVVISEGRNRQVRRMFESINREVIFLKRAAIGDLKLGGLNRGEVRELKEKEVQFLKTI